MDCPWQGAKVWVALCFHFEIWDRLGLHYGLPLAGCQSLGCFMFPLWNLRQTWVTLWIALGRVPKFGLLYVSTLKLETDLGYIMDCPWQGAKVWVALCFHFETWDRLGLHYGLPLAGCQSLGCFMFPLWNLRQTWVTLWIALGRVPKFGVLCFHFEIWDRLWAHCWLSLAGCKISCLPHALCAPFIMSPCIIPPFACILHVSSLLFSYAIGARHIGLNVLHWTCTFNFRPKFERRPRLAFVLTYKLLRVLSGLPGTDLWKKIQKNLTSIFSQKSKIS